MKKYLLIISILFTFYSCKKDNSNNNKPTSWISGKWKRESMSDTIYNGNVVYGVNNFTVNSTTNVAEINFSSDASGTSSIPTYGSFNYSLTASTLIYSNNVQWNIIQVSSIRLKLTMHESQYGIGWEDDYVKE